MTYEKNGCDHVPSMSRAVFGHGYAFAVCACGQAQQEIGEYGLVTEPSSPAASSACKHVPWSPVLDAEGQLIALECDCGARATRAA